MADGRTRGAGQHPLTRLGWTGAAAFPVILFVAHLAYGADHAAAGQWFVLAVAACLVMTVMTTRSGKWAVHLPRLRAPGAWGALTLIVAACSLISFPTEATDGLREQLGMSRTGTINTSATILEMIKLSGLACAFLLGVMRGARPDGATGGLNVLLALGTAYALFTTTLFFSGNQVLAGDRLSGGFLSANSGALVFGMLAVLALAKALGGSRRRGGFSLVAASQTALFFGCLVLTASRAGLASTLVAMAGLLIWDAVRRRQVAVALLVGAFAAATGAAFVLASGNDLLWRRADTLHQDAGIRAAIFNAHWDVFLASPMTGYGLGAFTELNNLAMTPGNFGQLDAIRSAHNVYLQWLEEAGVIGAFTMFTTIGVILAALASAAWRRRTGNPAVVGALAVSLLVMLHGAADFGLQIITIAAFWSYILGLGIAAIGAGGGRGRRADRSREFWSRAANDA